MLFAFAPSPSQPLSHATKIIFVQNEHRIITTNHRSTDQLKFTMPGLKRSLHVSQMTGSSAFCTATFFELQRPTQQHQLRKPPSSSADALLKMELVFKCGSNKDANTNNSRCNEQWKTVQRVSCDPADAAESGKRSKLSELVECTRTHDSGSKTTQEFLLSEFAMRKFKGRKNGSKNSVKKGAGLAFDSEIFRLFCKEAV